MDLQPALSQSLSSDLEAQLARDPFEDHHAFAAHALAKSLFKKFSDGAHAETANARAIRKFLDCNSDMQSFKVVVNTSLDEMLVNGYLGAVTRFFENGIDSNRTWWTLPECFKFGYAGPGASIGARGHDFYTKFFDSRLTMTSQVLYDSFMESLQQDPVWAQAETLRHARYGSTVVEGSKLSFVPKTLEVSRTVCTEPSLNMFYQLGFGCLITKELKHQFGVSLRDQPSINRKLAYLGSRDNSFCTIDLESASDRIGFHLLPRRFPGRGLIDLLRSPSTRLPGDVVSGLHMVSTMGCGFTFPLMTLTFMCMIVSAYESLGIKPRFGRNPNCAVFGDDLIVVPEAEHRILRLLSLLGMKVNAEKSFFTGPFRESCGHDFFNGHPVRGVYCKTLLAVQDRVSLVNRLNRWSYETGQPVSRTVEALLTGVDRCRIVPLWESDDCGVHVPLSLVPKRRHDSNNSLCYLAWRSKTNRLHCSETVIVSPRAAKSRQLNSLGLLVCLLEGSLRRGMISLRKTERLQYRTKPGLAPMWDAILDERFYSTVYRRRYERAVWSNLAGWLEEDLQQM